MSEEARPTGRRERRKLEMRERIMEAATSLFEDSSYEETKVSEICERADIAYGTFFSHFPGKEDLLRALAEKGMGTLSVALAEIAEQPGSIEDHLGSWFELHAQTLESLSPARRSLLGRLIAFRHAVGPRESQFHEAIQSFVEAEVAAGRIRNDVCPTTIAEILTGTYLEMLQSFVHFDDYPLRERSSAAASFLARSLQPPPHS